MSQRVCRSIGELIGHGGCLVARCRPCGRTVIFSISALDSHFKERGWDTEFRAVKARMRCKRCRRYTDNFGYHQGETPTMPRAMSVEVRAPAGIDPVDWYMAPSDDMRKQMVRRARG